MNDKQLVWGLFLHCYSNCNQNIYLSFQKFVPLIKMVKELKEQFIDLN